MESQEHEDHPRITGSRSASSARPLPPSQAPRRRCYPVCFCTLYSLREAAYALDLDERQLRREILLNDLPAIDVADERHYLILGRTLMEYVRAIRPEEEIRFDTDHFFPWM